LDLGLVEGSGEVFGGEDVGEVDERAGRGRHADPVVRGGVGLGGAVDLDARVARSVGAVTWVVCGQRANPSATSCARVTTPCCRAANSASATSGVRC
jgi:hypothetical protein